MSERQVYLDGQFLPLSEARVSVEDRGFLFGDGVYEVLRASSGKLYAEAAHWRRLASSCRDVALALPDVDLHALALELLERNGLSCSEATVYLQLTRGAASPRTHHFPPQGTRPTRPDKKPPYQPNTNCYKNKPPDLNGPAAKVLRPATENLAAITPDLRKTFDVLNYFLNEWAYNPPGQAEGFLFYTLWGAHIAASVYANQDAHASVQRGLILTTCRSLQVLKNVTKVDPQLATIIELTNLPTSC